VAKRGSTDLRDKSLESWEKIYKDLKPVNDDPEELVSSGAEPGSLEPLPEKA